MFSEGYSHASRVSVGGSPRPGCFNDKEDERSFNAPRRYRAGFASRSRCAPQRLQCESPSTDSTTSLAQLRERLTTLSPIVFNKVTAKIAVTPDLAAVKEQDEYERLSKSEPRPRGGVVLYRNRYHSDSDSLTKKTRELGQVVEKHSASLNLVAALGTSDQSVIEETFSQLYEHNPHVDLSDLLVEEAIKHGQDKDSGIISGIVTNDIDSDIVEDTPVEEPARRVKLGLRRRPKHNQEYEYSTDDSDVVDDTPCYDWNKKEHSKYDCIIIDDIKIYATEKNATNLAIDANIIDCVNHLLDKVCYNLENCMNLLGEEQEIDILGVAKNNHYRSSDTSNISKINKNTPKSTKNTLHKHDIAGAKRVTLKFKHQKQAPKMNTTRQKKSKRIIHPKKVEEDTELQASTDTKSPSNNEKRLTRKKRKLYSPKDDDNEDQNSLRPRKESRPSSSTESPIAACYKELENARNSRNRLPRKRASMQPVISPKTKNLNDMFDKIKDNVVNNGKITLVDKKSQKDLDLYNMSSESDDDAFKKKKIQVQKRISSSSLESTSKHIRSVKPVNYTPYYSSEDECHRVVEPKAVKQTKRRNRNAKKIRRTNLADERMRTQQAEVLETSFVEEKRDTHIPDELEPALQMPVLEEIQRDDLIDEPIIPEKKSQTPKKSEIIKTKTKKSMKKKCDKPITSKGKEIVTDVAIERGSATVSPLPGLVVETEPPKDDLTSSLDANLFQKLKKIYTEADDLSTTRDTQNLVLNNTIDGTEVNMLNEIGDRQNVTRNLCKYNDNAASATGNIQTMNISDVLSEKSVATCGDSPITDHNNADEFQPNLYGIYESFQHRDVDIDRSIATFLDNMRNQIINSNATAMETSTILGVIEEVERKERTKMSSKDSARSNVSVRKQQVESNEIPINKSSDIGFDKTQARERLLSKDVTRMSPKDSARSVLAADKLPVKSISLLNVSTESASDKSNPRVLLERMSSEDIESLLNPATPKSKSSASRVLNKLAPENRNIVTPSRSNTTTSSVPVDMVDRVSSDEINNWLPVPVTGKVIEEPRIAKNNSTRRRSVAKACTICETTKPEISPVKLSFNAAELTRVTRSKTRSLKSVRSLSDVNKLRTESDQSIKELGNISKDTNSQETAVKSSKQAADENPSKMSRSLASVQSWLRDAAAESSKTDKNSAVKEAMYEEVMEMLTRLFEINNTSGDALQAALLKDQEELLQLDEELRRKKAMIDAVRKSQLERACVLIRTDAENKASMMLRLKESMERIFK